MKKLLHVIATPRAAESRTLKVSKAFLETLKNKYPDCRVDELNTTTEHLPSLTVKMIGGKYALLGGGELSGEQKIAWRAIEEHIKRFSSADAYLISTPMWNFGIPYPLKQYIDIIVQPKYLFRYTEKGPEGLVKNKRMAIITSRGGDYGPASPFRQLDLQEPYLKAVFGFVGLQDIIFIHAQPMDASGPEAADAKLKEAARKASDLAGFFLT